MRKKGDYKYMKKINIVIGLLWLSIGTMGCSNREELTITNSSTTKVLQASKANELQEQNDRTGDVKIKDKENEASGVALVNVVTNDENNIPFLLDVPPFEYYLSDKVKVEKPQPLVLTLNQESANRIIDEDKWFQDNDLKLNRYDIADESNGYIGNLPNKIEKQYNDKTIVSAFYDNSYIYCVYGTDYSDGNLLRIYDSSSLELLYFLDFSNYILSPDYEEKDYEYISQAIKWASIKDNILYISNNHITYAKSSHNLNGYITAINLSDKSILWRSEALVQNAADFLIAGNSIICGYGFTDELDYLYQLDISTGRIIDSISLKTAPSYILKKDDILYVRTYNTNYEFKINEPNQ